VSRLENVREKSSHLANDLAVKLSPHTTQVREQAALAAHEAKDWAAPRLETARERVRDDLVPRLAEAVTAAVAAVEPAREEVKHRGGAALAALRGEEVVVRRKKRRWPKLLVVLGAVGAAGAAVSAWLKQRSEPDWVSEARAAEADAGYAMPDQSESPGASPADGTVGVASLNDEVTAQPLSESPTGETGSDWTGAEPSSDWTADQPGSAATGEESTSEPAPDQTISLEPDREQSDRS